MKYTVQKSVSAPAYLQLYQQVRDDIVAGIYPYHSKLPSKRTLAEEVGVSTITVEHAYALLSDEGYIEASQRSGYFVIFRPADGFLGTADAPPAPFHETARSAGAQTTLSYSLLAKTMRRVLSDYGEAVLEKSPNAGCEALRVALKRYLARSRGIQVETRQILIGSGSEYLYTLIVELLGREQIYAIESPSYQKIEQVYRAADVTYERLPLGTNGIESTALWASQADVLHISPYRSFPSGVTATASKRHEYLRWAGNGKRYLVEDDFESEFSISRKPEETLFSHASHDTVIYMNTFSKTVSPSLRVGYMVLPPPLVAVFEEKLGFYSCTVPTFEQFVLTELIESGEFERHINRVRRQKRKEMAGEA